MKKLFRKPKGELYCECHFSSLQGDTVSFYYGQNDNGKMNRYAKVKDQIDEWWLLNKEEFKDENRTETFIKIMRYFGKFYTVKTPF